MDRLLAEAQELFPYTQALRRDFHRFPELGFQEVRTSGIVARQLQELGIEFSSGIGRTGIAALIEGASPGRNVLLRVDMDALPIVEDTGAEYASQNHGVMHACGHDAHTAIGLTVARLLHAHRLDFSGSVKLVFQPAEEGMGGAQAMIDEGVLENPRPDACLGLHVWNEMPFGWISATPGPVMAASETFRILITGKGGHGAVPHSTIDPVVAAAQVIGALQTIVSRNVAPLESAVVSVTMVRAGEAHNVIPSQAELKGTIRSFEPAVRQVVLERFHQVVQGVAAALSCTAEIELHSLTPAVVNHPAVTARVQAAVRQLKLDAQLDTHTQTMGSEDMALFQQALPGSYIFVGSADPGRALDYPHHHPKFDIDEAAMPWAAAIMAAAALNLLEGEPLSAT